MPISQDQKKAWELWKAGYKQREIASKLDFNAISTVNYHIHRFEQKIEESTEILSYYLEQTLTQFNNTKASLDFLHHFLISLLPPHININMVDFPLDGLFIPRE